MEEKFSRCKLILSIAIPMVIQGIVFQIQSLTDKAFLGNVDSKYISALGAAQFPLGATMDSVVALGTGLIIFVSQLYGARRKNEISGYVNSSIFYSTILSSILFCLWFFCAEPILKLLAVDPKIMDDAVCYAKICSIYLLFLGLDGSLQSMLQGIGKTKMIMVSGIVKVILNILISWCLIFGHFGFPKLYVKGAAIGSLIANVISVTIIAIYCFYIKRKEFNLLSAKGEFLRFSLYRKVVALGIPTALEYFCWNASNLVLLRFLNGISVEATAIYTLTFGVEIIVFAIFGGNSKGAMTLIGQKIGSNDHKEANSFFQTSLALNTAIVALFIAIFSIFPKQILGIFTNESEVVNMSVPFLIMTAVIMFPKSINVITGNTIRAYGNTKWMLFTQIIGSILVVTCSFFLVRVFHLGVVAIYITLFMDETTRALINYVYYINNYRKKQVVNSLT